LTWSPLAKGQEITQFKAAVAMQDVLVAAIERAEKSVVAIARVRKGGRTVRIPDDSDNRFAPNPRQFGLSDTMPTSPDFIPNEFASGVVVDREGHIVTNYHVLGDPEENDYYVWVRRRPFKVTRVEVPQEIKAGDPWTDLAVLKISANDLEPMPLGDASTLRKGMIVIALGNPYGIARDGDVSASWGIISNLRRAAIPPQPSSGSDSERDSVHQYGTLIQTDARLNLGTSGGALINLKGEMIGLTTSLAAMADYEQPAGFAIPVDEAFRKTVDRLKTGRLPAFGFLGVQPENRSLADRQQGQFGARVLRVVPGTPADRAELRQDDVITHVGDAEVYDRNTLFRELSKRLAETPVTLTIARRDALRQRWRSTTVNVVLSKKFIETARRPFAQVAEPTWRGLQVEYPSALPPQLSTQGIQAIDRKGCVAIIDVARDSQAWKAGLRRGEYISHVENLRVSTPAEFHAAVAGRPSDVRLRLTTGSGEAAIRIIEQ
jgi:serine protease Do